QTGRDSTRRPSHSRRSAGTTTLTTAGAAAFPGPFGRVGPESEPGTPSGTRGSVANPPSRSLSISKFGTVIKPVTGVITVAGPAGLMKSGTGADSERANGPPKTCCTGKAG